jgi:heme-degrading monooxygenase HmoA
LLITSATDGTLPTASSQAGLLRRYSVRSEDGKLAWIDLWSSKAAAQAFFNSSELARLHQSMGAVQIEYFKTPIVLPSTLPENQQGDAS